MRSSFRTLFAVLLLLAALFLGGLLVSRGISPRKFTIVPSSYAASPFGYKAIYLAMEKAGRDAVRWQLPLEELNRKGLLIYARRAGREPATRQIRVREADALRGWISRGNTVLLLEPDPDRADAALFGAMGLSMEAARSELTAAELLNLQQDVREAFEIRGTGKMRALTGCRVLTMAYAHPIDIQKPLTSLAGIGGSTYLAWAKIGRGRLYVASSASLFDNEHILRTDNLRFLLHLADQAGGSIIFHEYLHGYSDEISLGDVLSRPVVRVFLVQLGVLLLLFLLNYGMRFGRPIRRSDDRSRSSLEFVHSMGELYRRAGLKSESLLYLADRTRQHLLFRLGLPPSVGDNEIQARLDEHPSYNIDWQITTRDVRRATENPRLPDLSVRVAQRLMEIRNTT